MTNKNAEILNDVTKTLIDSQKGYENAAEAVDQSYALRNAFQERAQQRAQLVNQFQSQVRSYGEEPETDGGIAGSAHRAWQDFTSMFQSDEKAALNAIDDGEEYLVEQIEGKLKEDGLDMTSRDLLERAHASACEGENWADRMEDQIS